VTFAQFLELLRRLDFLEVHGRRCVRFLGVVTHRFLLIETGEPTPAAVVSRDTAYNPSKPM
jgi:hypothetical protein